MIAAAAAAAFSAVTTVAAAAGAAMGLTFTGLNIATAVSTLKVLSLTSSLVAMAKKPKAGLGSPTPIAFKADPNAPITFVAGKAGVGGNIVLGQTFGPKNRFLGYVTALSHGGPVHSIAPFTANDEQVTFGNDNGEGASGRYNNRMWQKFALGAVGAAALAFTSTANKYTPARNGNFPEWTANHRLNGIAHSLWAMWSDTERFPNGVPKPFWVVHGGPVYDPRKDSTFPGGNGPQRWNDRATWAHAGNENPYLHALTFLIGQWYNGVKVGGGGTPIEGIAVQAFVDGANVADANGWKLSLPWTTASRKWDVLATMLQAGGGRPLVRFAKISCVVSTPRVSIGEITQADLVADFSVQSTRNVRERKNTIIPRCRAPSLKWTDQPYGEVSVQDYIDADGERRAIEVNYEGVNGYDGGRQVRQLAAYDLAEMREGIIATLPCRPLMLKYRAGDCLTVNAPETLMNGQKVVVIKRDFDPVGMIVTLTVQSETDAKHDWALGRTAAPPPEPTLTGLDPNVLQPPAPAAWEIEPGVTPGGGGAGDPGMPVIVIKPGDPEDPTFDEPSATSILIRYRRAGLDPLTGLPYPWSNALEFPRNQESYELTGLAPGVEYEIQIAYKARGITSAWADYGTVTTGLLVASDAMRLGNREAGPILADLDAVPGKIAAAVAAIDLELSGALEDLEAAVEQIDLDVNDPTTGLKVRVGQAETIANGMASRVSALEVSVDTAGTGLKARTAALETATADLELGKADATRVAALEASVNTGGTGLLARTAALEMATADLAAGKADASRVETLEATARSGNMYPAIEISTARGGFTDQTGATNPRDYPGTDSIYAVAGEGPVIRQSTTYLGAKMRVSMGNGHAYRIRWRARRLTNVPEGNNTAYWYFAAFNDSGGGLGASSLKNVGALEISHGWKDYEATLTSEELRAIHAEASSFRIGVRFGSVGMDAAQGQVEVSKLEIENATSILMAEGKISSLETATADLLANKAEASALALVEAAVRSANVIPAIDIATARALYTDQTGITSPRDLPASQGVYAVPGEGVVIRQGTVYMGPKTTVPISPGQTFKIRWRARRLTNVPEGNNTAYWYARLFDSAGSAIVSTPVTNMGALNIADGWKNFEATITGTEAVTAHANSVAFRPGVRFGSVGQDAAQGQVEVSYISVSDETGLSAVDARVVTAQTAIADLQGNTRARWALGTAVPGAAAFIQAQAEVTPGSAPTSSVAIGARVLALYNQVGDNWLKALEVVNGNALFSGGLQAGAFIRLGNGNGWPVALKPLEFAASDGEVVAFGTDLGTLPALQFAMNNLAPLGAGETYDVRAENLTATGFTMRAKINVPATPSSQTHNADKAAVTLSSTPGQQIWLGGKPESVSGSYTINATGWQRHRFMGKQGQAVEADSYSYSYSTLKIWAFKSGAWVHIKDAWVETVVDPYGYPSGGLRTEDAYLSYSETIQLGSGVTHIAVTFAGSDSGQPGAITGIGPINWQSQGSGSGVRSATPNGQKTSVTVRPQ